MSVDDVREAVRRYIETNEVDFVKYSVSAHRVVKTMAFSPRVQRAIVEEAHDAGLIAQACTMTPEALNSAIEAGVDLLSHGDITGPRPMPSETLDQIVRDGLPCVAFLTTDRRVTAIREENLMGDLWSEVWLTKDANDRQLIERRAKLLLGNAAGVIPRSWKSSPRWRSLLTGPDPDRHLGSMHALWLQAAIERGMTPMDALASATRNIAEAYGRSDDLGTVEPGKRADLLLLEGNPLEDIDNYRRIVHVVKDGELVDRDALPEHPVLSRDVA